MVINGASILCLCLVVVSVFDMTFSTVCCYFRQETNLLIVNSSNVNKKFCSCLFLCFLFILRVNRII